MMYSLGNALALADLKGELSQMLTKKIMLLASFTR